jgi:cell division protein FtsB
VTSIRSLEEENAILAKKVERLEREVNDLKVGVKCYWTVFFCA